MTWIHAALTADLVFGTVTCDHPERTPAERSAKSRRAK